ncbi:LPS export ABC transporter periplasmic protein LptC [Gymnodinialimonas hymeniacidonis]|uniref:LPS export ABC transporter periplasmic protein LptC n=1 Tax=Gymnodinialimonas hymeniacidonis TaxID=3126508 RepID=UPI0034C5F29C
MARSDLYSKTVVWVKVTLPLIALALLSSLFLLSGAPDPDAALPYAEVDIEQITREQRVTSPRFAGVVGEDQEIIILAEAMTAESGQIDRIHAQAIDGRVDLGIEEVMTVQATLGDFDMAGQFASLRDGVAVQSSRGYQMESDTMLMALDEVRLRAPTPVHITGPGLDLTADAMEMEEVDGAPILRFTGSVRMLYDPES